MNYIKRATSIVILTFTISFLFCQKKPNILWLVCEDQSLFFSAYGDSNAYTPSINGLTAESTVYDNCFTTSPVCSPSRSSLITGIYPTSIGSHQMRTYKKNSSHKINKNNGLPYFSPLPSKNFKFFTEYLRLNGYYCTNNSKEDYNMQTSPLAWDESSKTAHWKNREKNQPFFAVFNFYNTHESNLWNRKEISNSEINEIILPPIFPNNKVIKHDFYTNYRNIEMFDAEIEKLISELKKDKLYDNTIIFLFSDHGGPFPRYKRSIYDTGIKCPLIIKWLGVEKTKRNEQMISFIDFAPTLLDITGIEVPHDIDGISFYNRDKRKFIYAATDRFDESISKRRCIRNKEFKLIRNFDTLNPLYKSINFRTQMASMKLLDSLNHEGSLNNYFEKWYNHMVPEYELYDINKDKYETKNLFNDKKYLNIKNQLVEELNKWINDSPYGNMSEEEMYEKMFQESKTHLLNQPKIKKVKNGIIINPNNVNSSVGWKNNTDQSWRIYNENEIIKTNDCFEIIVFKPGYEILMKNVDLKLL